MAGISNSPKTRYGEFRLNNGNKLYIPPHGAVTPGISAQKSSWNDIDVFTVDTTQAHPIGTLLTVGNRVYAYAEFGGTTAAGDLVQAESPAAPHDALAPAVTAAGANEFEVTMPGSGSDDFIANEYSGGIVYAQVNGSPGYAYDILEHDAGDISTTNTMTVVLYPGQNLAVALAVTDDLAFIKNPWKELIQAPVAGSETAPHVGVSMAVGADGSFGWIGVKGPHPVLTDGTVVVGDLVRVGTVAGSVAAVAFEQATDATRAIENTGAVGVVADVGGDTQWSLVNLFGFGLV